MDQLQLVVKNTVLTVLLVALGGAAVLAGLSFFKISVSTPEQDRVDHARDVMHPMRQGITEQGHDAAPLSSQTVQAETQNGASGESIRGAEQVFGAMKTQLNEKDAQLDRNAATLTAATHTLANYAAQIEQRDRIIATLREENARLMRGMRGEK